MAAGVPAMGLDGLASSAYGPEAALTVLLPAGVLGLAYIGPLTLVILALLAMLYFSYRQTIAAYPVNGGSYTVARENLGTWPGLLAAAALMIDYVLNVAVGAIRLLTPVEASAGVFAVTVGGFAVVNVQVTAAASGVPSAALTVVSSFAVYVVLAMSAALGVRVATFVVLL